jgi:hypothetical protein
VDRYNRNRSTILQLEAEALRAEQNALKAEEAARTADQQVEAARDRVREMTEMSPEADADSAEGSGQTLLPRTDAQPE